MENGCVSYAYTLSNWKVKRTGEVIHFALISGGMTSYCHISRHQISFTVPKRFLLYKKKKKNNNYHYVEYRNNMKK